MLNQTILVGRIVNDPEIKELDNGKKVSKITLAVPRSYKNADGEYDTDFVDCTFWNGVAQSIVDYCQKGDLIGIKGSLKTSLYEKDGKKNKNTEVIADKVTFLSSKTKETDVEESIAI